MATDAQVKEITLLRSYATRLSIFKDVVLAGCAAMLYKAESVKDDMQSFSNSLNNEVSQCDDETKQIISRFDDTVERYHLTANNSALLGSTANDAKEKMSQLRNCAEEINRKVSHIKSLITGLEERTGVYTLAVRSMSENGCEQLTKRCDVLEKYKELQA